MWLRQYAVQMTLVHAGIHVLYYVPYASQNYVINIYCSQTPLQFCVNCDFLSYIVGAFSGYL